jgi:type IV pilus assembly protein PilE
MNKKIKAFTLAELMIVLVIIGILVLLALPNLMPLISKAKSTEAKIHLEHIFNLEKSYFYLYSSYSIPLKQDSYMMPVVSFGLEYAIPESLKSIFSSLK